MLDLEEEEVLEEVVPENTLTLDNLTGVLIIQDCFGLLLRHGPFCDTGRKTNANGGRGIGII